MGVAVAQGAVGAFVALLVAVALIGVAIWARRSGHLRSRSAYYFIGAVVFVLVVYGMTGGYLPKL